LAIDAALLSARGPGCHDIIDTGCFSGIEHYREYAPLLCGPKHKEASELSHLRDRLGVTDLFNIVRFDFVSSDMSDVAGVPDKTANGEHRQL